MPGLLNAARQYFSDALPGGLLNPEWTPERKAQAVGLLADLTPVIGGAKGATEEWRAGNHGMAALNAATVPLDLLSLGGGTIAKSAIALAIDPAAKLRLIRDLIAGKGSGAYRLGDITEGQRSGLAKFFGAVPKSGDVYMTDPVFQHIYQGRMLKDGFSPEEIGAFAEQALAKRSKPFIDLSKSGQNPALLNEGLLDAETSRRYDALMPFRLTESDTLEPLTVVPRGLKKRQSPVR